MRGDAGAPPGAGGLRALLWRGLLAGLWALPLRRALPVLRWLSRWSRPRGPVSVWARETLGVGEAELPDWWSRAVFGARALDAVRDRARAGRVGELEPVLLPVDLSPLRRALSFGRGAILAGSHLGPPCAVRYVLMKAELPRLSLTLDAHVWDPSSLAIAEPAAAARSLGLALDRLRSGGVVYTGADHPGGSRRLSVSVLGQEVRLSRSLPTLARATRAPALTADAGWEGERIRVRFGERLPEPAEADPEAWDSEWLGAYAQRFEQRMREAPEDVGLMPRWNEGSGAS